MLAKLRILFWIGVVILFVPYLGVTSSVRTTLTIGIGALVIWLSFRIRKNYKELRFRMRRLDEAPTSTPELDIHTQ